MNLSKPVNYFSFWEPVTFSEESHLGKSFLSHLAGSIGSIADQYASLSSTKKHIITAVHVDARKIYFEAEKHDISSRWRVALKVASFVFSLGTLPLLALLIKGIFKRYLNKQIALTPNRVFAEKQMGNYRISLVYGSITLERTDAIVNAANADLWAGGGVCGAIRRAAGPVPFDQCKQILKTQQRSSLDCGEVVVTTAGELEPRIRAIVHAVGPDYRIPSEKAKGRELLKSAYQNSLELMANPHDSKKSPLISSAFSTFLASHSPKLFTIHSISFPSISTGFFNAPLQEAAENALETIKEFFDKNPGNSIKEVRFVFLSPEKDKDKTGAAYKKALEKLK